MKFLADEMLGRLAKWLKITGYDTVYFPKISDYELLRKASVDGRVILTRDRKLPEKLGGGKVVLIRSDHYLDQLAEVLSHLNIRASDLKIFSLCLDCNVSVREVGKEKMEGRVPPYVFEKHTSFQQCPQCHKVFWSGSHYVNALDKLRGILS